VRRAIATAAALACAAALAGCGTVVDINRGGRVAGTTLTIYTQLPQTGVGASRDMVDAEKLALYEARGAVGAYKINFIAIDEGPPGSGDGAKLSALALRDSIADPQVIAMIGPAGSDTATATVPLFNAAGILEVTPGAGYPGFTTHAGPGEPARWQPSGRRTLGRIVGDDRAQAPALLAAAAAATRRAHPRVAIEQEPGRIADEQVQELRKSGAHVVDDEKRADAVIYAGEDPQNAAGVAEGLAREGIPVVLPDAVTRGGAAGLLGKAARRNAIFVSSAPEPGSTPALRHFEASFREQFRREPGPYAAVGYDAMRAVLDALRASGDRVTVRQAVVDAYFRPGERTGGLLGDMRVAPDGSRVPARFTAFRLPRAGRPTYLNLR
jgi:ABC-type branched-subunit amino acid transport system substrate-binding protein